MDPASKIGVPNLEQALALRVKSRQWAEAARLALQLERPREAARYFLEASQPYDAAVCFQKAQDLDACLEALMRVPTESPRYRTAAVHAIRVALTLGAPPSRLSPFLVPFLSRVPASRAEAAALTQLAHALRRDGKQRLSKFIFRSVCAAFPDDAEAREGLASAPATENPLKVDEPEPAPAPPARPPTLPGARTPSAPMSAVRPSTGERAPRVARLVELLVAQGQVAPEQLQKLLARHRDAAASDVALGEVLVSEGLLGAEDTLRAVAEAAGQSFIGEAKLLETATAEAAAALPVEQAERWTVAPIALIHKTLFVAMRDPRDFGVLDQLRFASGVPQVSGVFATELAIRKAISKLYHAMEPEEPDDWRGRVWDPSQGHGASAPFSDRYTGTREHEFNTREMELRAQAEVAPPSPAMEKTLPPQSPPVAPPAPQAGELFAQRYRLEALLGTGGSAAVYRALDMELNERVALKLFHPSVQTEALLARFKLELSLARRLSHPNVIRLFDLGHHQDWRYLTMELLEGTDLASSVASLGRPMELADGLRVLEQACAGLQAAHERGVIHRDVKPQNLFVTRDGTVKVMDFGIAKEERGAGVTLDGSIAGTPEFMSPEQIVGFSKVTHLTDLYALGATAYVLFTGAPPFEFPELTKVLLAHLHQAAPSPRARNPAIPPTLEAVILTLMEKDPARRMQSCRELGAALARIREELEPSQASA